MASISASQNFLRKRISSSKVKVDASPAASNEVPREPSPRRTGDEVVWGKTPGGEVFRVPTTHDVLTALFHPSYPKSHIDVLNLGLLGLQLVLFFALPPHISKPFFLAYFVFWRTAYDAGLGWVLTKQSKKKWIVREVQRLGWLDASRRPAVRQWIGRQLAGKMGKDYNFGDLPVEYNTWLLFRQLVDIILLNDFLSYCMFAFLCFRVPDGLSMIAHAFRWGAGVALIAFNLWVKTEAHTVVKDYGWYWGDTFFQRGALVFDGVFELAPHPMYSVGYAGYYGLSLIVGSYPVLFVSLAAHAAQFAFLLFFENPHIERMYGQRKPIAQRGLVSGGTAFRPKNTSPNWSSSRIDQLPGSTSESSDQVSTPSVTDGETATDSTDVETETETESEVPRIVVSPKTARPKLSPSSSTSKILSSSDARRLGSSKAIYQHDLMARYFRQDTILLHNFDLLRASDFMLLLLIAYGLGMLFVPPLQPRQTLILHFAHAFAWCMFHNVVLGLLLRAQSDRKFLVRHYLKHYHYSANETGRAPVLEAFNNWKVIYNMSMCMTYVSFTGLVWKTYSLPFQWTVGDELLRHTLGALLVGLHIWASFESYEVLGVFGWFYGDFFMEDFPSHLEYTGIYRYLNNPEVMSGAAFFGLTLVTGSRFVLALAVVRFLSHWWFLRCVENPHMRKLYGDSLRKEAGFLKVIRNVASRNAKMLESRAGRHGPELKKVVKEVKGTFDKVYEETAEAVEDFLTRSKPRISEVVQDTKVMLQQSRERLVITRVAADLSSYDPKKYKISIVRGNGTDGSRFHLGEHITVKWQSPYLHSRRDWIGIYRIGANKSNLVTNTSSLGMWVPVHDDEWDGDIPLGRACPASPGRDSESGQVIFKGNALPWLVGKYEVRYHHDGKYNVMSLDGPFEVYVDKPAVLDFVSVREWLMRTVPLCLDSDATLMPVSCSGRSIGDENSEHDPDDFTFWSERQAKRICVAIKQAFGVEYAPQVITADANLSTLANRILVSMEILTT